MPLIPDEEQFDSRLPPWAIDAGDPGEQPEAMLSSDAAGDPERLLEIDLVPDPSAEPDGQQHPQDAAQAWTGNAVIPAGRRGRLARHQAELEGRRQRRQAKLDGRKQRRQERQINPREVQEFQQKAEEFQRLHGQAAVQGGGRGAPPPQMANRPPTFPLDWKPQGGGFQQVVANMDVRLGDIEKMVPDEMVLAEERTMDRGDQSADMESITQSAEAESQLASTIEVQSQNIHNTLSRLRDVEAAFMRTNYV